jgi:hypothetical protein
MQAQLHEHQQDLEKAQAALKAATSAAQVDVRAKGGGAVLDGAAAQEDAADLRCMVQGHQAQRQEHQQEDAAELQGKVAALEQQLALAEVRKDLLDCVDAATVYLYICI